MQAMVLKTPGARLTRHEQADPPASPARYPNVPLHGVVGQGEALESGVNTLRVAAGFVQRLHASSCIFRSISSSRGKPMGGRA